MASNLAAIVDFPAILLACLVAAQGVAVAQNCSTCVPLDDLGPATYSGEVGGLYPGGSNSVPAGHAAAALRAAQGVVPRTATGAPHPDGLVGVLSIGVSSFAQEWREVTRRVDGDPGRNGHLVLVDGAINAATSDRMSDPQSFYWTVIERRVATAGLSAAQVQVVFIETSRFDSANETFPGRARSMRDELAVVVRDLRVRFPNLRITFVTSLIYAGYALGGASEPRIYENAFAVKWLIEDQISGDPALQHDARSGPVVAPVLLWGPYLWANGASPRSDGLVWLPGDMQPDGFHPSSAGEAKVADLYEQFLDASPAARAIFAARPGVTRASNPIDGDATLDTLQPNVALGAAASLDVELPSRTALVRASIAPFTGALRHAKLALEPIGRAGDILAIGLVDVSWDEATVTASNGPTFGGTPSLPLTLTSETSLAEWDVTPWTQVAVTGAGGPVAFGLEKTTATLLTQFFSRESGRPGWLALTIDRDPGGVEAFCAALAGSSGAPATLAWTGGASLAAADLVFSVADLPAFAVILPLVGTASAELPLTGGDLCVGGALLRLPLVAANALGRASFTVDWGASGANVLPGDSRVVQAVFRDSVPEGYRTTSSTVIVFRP